MKKQIIITLFILWFSPIIHAQTAKYSNEFLSIGIGARGLSMSNSVSATTTNADAAYWNPAGLALLEGERELSLMHAEYFAGIAKYDYGSLAARIDNTSVIGLSFIRFGVDDIPDTSELIDSEGNINYDKVKSFSAADYAFMFSYARKSDTKGLQYGGNIKVVRRTAGDFASSWGFGADLGVRYETGKWVYAAMGRDITTTFNAWSYNLNEQMKEVFTLTGNDIPASSIEVTLPKFILASARKFSFSSKWELTTELDVDVTTDGKRNVPLKTEVVSVDPHFGMELGFNDFIYIRGGIGNLQQEKSIDGGKTTTFQPNVGIGLNIKDKLFVDYAFTDLGNNSMALYSNIFSLRLMFNKKDNSE